MSPIWFTIIYAIGAIVGIRILALRVKRYWRKQHEIGLASKRALANFEILPEDLKLVLFSCNNRTEENLPIGITQSCAIWSS